MRVRASVLLYENLDRRDGLLGDHLGFLLQGVQDGLEAPGHVRQERRRAAVGERLYELQTARLCLLRVAIRDPRQHGAEDAAREQVPTRQQHCSEAQACTAAFDLGHVVVGLRTLQLVQQVRHEVFVAQRRQARGQGTKALGRLVLDALCRVHQALLQHGHQLVHVGHQEPRVRDQIHRRAHDLHTLHLRLVSLLAHRPRHDREDEAERTRVDGVHEGRVGHAMERRGCLLHVRAVQDAGDDGVRHAPDLGRACDLLAHVPEQNLGFLLDLLPRVAHRIAHGHHDLRHLQPELLGRVLLHPVDDVL
mmetsp:Transcript_72125/g.220833  ORF Transcript_72125/g.220833 Transcript_72125/m.220833 type:complete len:306 (+) Transcript_72125:1297-2214(+)